MTTATPKDPDAPPPAIAIAAGSTGGHRHIGQAIGEAYQIARPEGRVLYISSTRDSRLQLDPVPGWRYEQISSSPFTGQRIAGKISAVRTLAASIFSARRLLASQPLEMVVGCGSFASVAVVLAARTLGIPTVIHEANRVPGRANRLVMPVVDRILLGLEPDTDVWAPPRHLVVGNPIRRTLAEAANSPAIPYGERRELLVLGGSQGSAFLNARAPSLLKAISTHGDKPRIWHQAGEHPIDVIRRDYERLGINAVVRPFLDRLDHRYANARLAITTAGAVTLEELAAFGLPALLVPLRNAADDHQSHNARYVARLTGTPWCVETAWDETSIVPQLEALLRDETRWRKVAGAMKGLWQPDAADAIASCLAPVGKSQCESVASRT